MRSVRSLWALMAGASLPVLLLATVNASATSAYAQTARDWSRVWCRAIDNCSPGHPLYSSAVFAVVRRSALQAAPRSNYQRFAFATNPTFTARVQRPGAALLRSLSPIQPMATLDTWKGGTGNWSVGSNWSRMS